jgi:hypothetical protein
MSCYRRSMRVAGKGRGMAGVGWKEILIVVVVAIVLLFIVRMRDKT